MEIEIKEIASGTLHKYPYLGISSTNLALVMFTEKNKGLMIKGGTANSDISNLVTIKNWDESVFVPFQGTIVIKHS